MVFMNKCLQCGNDIGDNMCCPFCGFEEVLVSKKKKKKMRVVNIKENMPICIEAEKILVNEIRKSKDNGYKILKIIHGYGSSGKGGELRWCLREYLQAMINRKSIYTYIAGEDLSSSNRKIYKMVMDYSILRKDKDYNKSNRGVTFIIL
jgi:hypothetical protein